MAGYLRLRQICLVAPNLGQAEKALKKVLGLQVCYRDPQVAKYGLENALWPVGDMFLEVVAPTRPDTAAGRFLERSGGRGGYMVIFDCSDPRRRGAHAREVGVRVANEISHDAYTGVQLHPRDCRAAMIEFNHTEGGGEDANRYAPAGPDWLEARRTETTQSIRAVELASPDPTGLSAHWAAIIEHPFADATPLQMHFSEAALHFVAADGAERLSALHIAVRDPAAVRRHAADFDLEPTSRGFICAGVEWVLA